MMLLMKATEKHIQIDEALQRLTGHNRVSSIEGNMCSFCGKPVYRFKNDLSLREYQISGMCQNCQDKVFD